MPDDARRIELPPPGAIYFAGEDALRIRSFNTVAGVVLTVAGRFLNVDGSLTPFTFEHTPNTDRTVATTLRSLAHGWLLDLNAYVSTGSPSYGQTFVWVEFVRGLTGAVTPLVRLLQGLITANQGLGWPGSRIRATLDGEGVVRLITGTDPGAGTQITETVPTGAIWELLVVSAQLVTNINVGNRRVRLELRSGGIPYFASAATIDQPASTTRRHYWAGNMAHETSLTADAAVAGLLTPHRMLAGETVVTQVAAFDLGDDWGAPTLIVREWFAGA